MTPTAAEFAALLRETMAARGASQRGVALAIGVTPANVSQWMRADGMPMVATANRLAETLLEPRLLSMIVTARTARCARLACGRTFVDQSSRRMRIFCSTPCRRLTDKGAARRRTPDGRDLAIAAMCRACEPDGACREPRCPLRAYSPLPLVDRVSLPLATRLPRWTLERKAALSVASKAMHAQPGFAERHRRAVRASMTPEVKAKIGASLRAYHRSRWRSCSSTGSGSSRAT